MWPQIKTSPSPTASTCSSGQITSLPLPRRPRNLLRTVRQRSKSRNSRGSGVSRWTFAARARQRATDLRQRNVLVGKQAAREPPCPGQSSIHVHSTGRERNHNSPVTSLHTSRLIDLYRRAAQSESRVFPTKRKRNRSAVGADSAIRARLADRISAVRSTGWLGGASERVEGWTFRGNARDGRRSRLFRNDDAPASRIAEGLHCASAAQASSTQPPRATSSNSAPTPPHHLCHHRPCRLSSPVREQARARLPVSACL